MCGIIKNKQALKCRSVRPKVAKLQNVKIREKVENRPTLLQYCRINRKVAPHQNQICFACTV